MSIIKDILNVINQINYDTVSLQEIYELFPYLPESSIRSALSRYKNKEIISPGVYKFEIIKYQLYRHAKRIVDTHSNAKGKHPYDLDIEMTIQGSANTLLDMDVIDRIVNPELVTATLELLSDEGVLLIEDLTFFKVTGSEWKETVFDRYDPYWTVEVMLTNQYGSKYTYQKTVYISEDEF